ncbi:MAG: hypothetical protein A3F16_02050 [Deltaproteobacteria bacterium RIFCSPHIGHO2_12_FULL_43_9]|nr:MAG: hypothetical protein A3F16_02050 [Deltaproteobacteria bacterium RIFCSPHIGHO2_12_FULL_43_9]
MKERNITLLVLFFCLQGCGDGLFKLAGSGGGSAAAMRGIHYNQSYIGSMSVVDASSWNDWHSQTMFFEHFGGFDNQSKREINEENFDGKIKILNSKDDYKVQIVFKTEGKNSNEISAIFKRGLQEGNLIAYNGSIFSKDVIIKRPNIKTLSTADLKTSKDWKIFVSQDGNEIEGYRSGSLNSPDDEKSVVRFRVYLDKYKIAPLPQTDDRASGQTVDDSAADEKEDDGDEGGSEEEQEEE